MPPLDPWRAAYLLLHRHGDDAELHAARRADELAEAGDEVGWASPGSVALPRFAWIVTG